jgi:O-succinylbenzoic acid--CoA ligase
MAALSMLDVDQGVGILVDISQEGVFLLLACMRLGLRTAICPLRENAAVIGSWLTSLGINTVVSSRRDFYGCALPSFYVDDLLKTRNICVVDRSSSFSSLLRTSGTTALPKTASISAFAHRASARAVCEYFSYNSKSSWALSLPLYHVSGISIIFRALIARSSIYVACTQDEAIFGLEHKRISHISLVPTQLTRMLNENVDFSVNAIVIGGDAMPSSLREYVRARKMPVFTTYGLTETASMMWAYDLAHDVGGLLNHATIQFAPDGEIMVGGASLFDGYISDQRVANNLTDDGFFPTGDLGHVRGHELIVEGRKHHRIISGGENIQAEEVERIIEQHDDVESCVVVGLFDPDFGMRPYAIIKWRNPPACMSDFTDQLRLQLASYKIPKILVPWPSDAPTDLKKPRLWLQRWLPSALLMDKSVIVGA